MKLYKQYRLNLRRLDNLSDLSIFDNIKVILTALTFSIVGVAPIIMLWVNLLIFVNFAFFFALLIIMSLIFGVFIYFYIYYEATKIYCPKASAIETWQIVLFETLLVGFIVTLLGSIVLANFF